METSDTTARPDGDGHDDVDGLFQEVLAGYVDRLNAGEMLLPEEIREQYPAWAERILAQLVIFQAIGGEHGDHAPLGTFGDYRIISELGSGGMGVVYEAFDPHMDRRVAIKVLPAGLKVHEKAVTRFRREARIVGKLRHPNIVSVYATGVEEGTPYITMEFVEGETLERTLERKRPRREDDTRGLGSRILTNIQRAFAAKDTVALPRRPGNEAALDRPAADDDSRSPIPASTEDMDLSYSIRMARNFAGVAEGLEHAHSKGVVHRDLKPSNLILDAEGNLRILDFGLAHLEGQESLTGSGEIVGTPRYMSPEQARAREVSIDHRTDIYSLGATLYEVLTLRAPFQGKTAQETVSQIIHHDPRPLHAHNVLVPRDLETIVLKCLRKSPSDRYGTAEALAQDLRRFARGAPIEARPRSWGEKMARRAWQHRGKVAVVLVLVILGASTGWLLYDRARAARASRLANYDPQVQSAIMKLEISGLLNPGIGSLIWQTEGWNIEPLLEGLGTTIGSEFLGGAIARLREAATDVPDRPDAHYHLGRALLLRGQRTEAMAALEKAIDRGFVPAMVLAASDFHKHGDPEAARRLLSRARSSGDVVWTDAWLAAHEAARDGRWNDAIAAYETLMDRLKTAAEPYLGASIEVHLGCGVAWLELREFARARQSFSVASALWPGAIEPEIFLGMAWFGDGDKDRAADIFKRLHERSSSDVAALHVSLFYLFVGDPETALAWGERLSPGDGKDLWIATCLRNLGRHEEAFNLLEGLVARGPVSAMPYLSLSLVASERGDLDRSTELAFEAIRRAPQSALPRSLLAQILETQGELQQSLEVMREAARVDPTSAAVHWELGKMLTRRGLLEEAARSLKRCLELERSLSVGSSFFGLGNRELTLGEVYRDLGQPRQALTLFCRAVEVNLANPAAVDSLYLYNSLATLLARPGLPDLADDLDRFIEWLDKKTARMVAGEAPRALVEDHRAALVLARLHGTSRRDRVAAALAQAERLTQSTGNLDPRSLELHARALLRNGQERQATRILDRAFRLPGHGLETSPFLEDALRDYVATRGTELPSYAAIDEALDRVRQEEIVPAGAGWRFHRGRQPPSEGLEWTVIGFDDSEWEEGTSGIGYGDADDATVLDDMQGQYTTVYTRHTFRVSERPRWAKLVLSVCVDDGFVAYLNGREIGRYAVRWEPIVAHDAKAFQTALEPLAPVEMQVPVGQLRPGKNVLAIQGVNASFASSDFSLIPVLRGEVADRAGAVRTFQGAFRERVRGDNLEGRLAFLEGRLLEEAEDHATALTRFEAALRGDPESVEAHQTVAECLRAVGRSPEAAAMLRQGIEKHCPGYRELWERWGQIELVDLKKSAEALLADFPCPGAFPVERVDTVSPRGGYGTEFSWLLGQLRDGGTLRINCGGRRYIDGSGRLWGRDCFYVGGRSATYLVAIHDTSIPPVHQSERYYPGGTLEEAGYRIPLPVGRYRLALHFTEIFDRITKPGQRVFDVVIEGETRVADYDAFARVGHSTPDRVALPVTVIDGHLDIHFIERIELPKITAIEITRTDGDEGEPEEGTETRG